jgi:mannose-6-phosphate isomerase class I
MQPIKFKPILKETIWGGCKIPRIKHISGLEDKHIGESWEISGLDDNESVVDGGAYDGKSLSQLIDTLKGNLVGEENYRRFGNRFPLLIKFIDARQDLSIQVHPDDETALRHGMVNGKNEMWYLLDSEPYASLRCGLKEELSADDIIKKVDDSTICDSIAQYDVKAGDCFYIPAGRVLSVIREQLHREPSDGDIYIVMSKDRRIVRLFAYDNRSYSLFEKKFVAGYQFMRIIKDDEGNEVAYRIDWKDVVLLLENPVIKSLKIR